MAHSSIVSLVQPQWTVSFDNDVPTAKATRSSTLARLAKDQARRISPFPGSAMSWRREMDLDEARRALTAVDEDEQSG